MVSTQNREDVADLRLTVETAVESFDRVHESIERSQELPLFVDNSALLAAWIESIF